MNKFTVAVLQLDSQDDVQKNLDTVTAFVEEAAGRGAKLITMPESMNYVGLDNAGHAEEIPGGKTFELMAGLAKKYNVWLHCGSIYEKNPDDARPYNATMVIRPDGTLAAKYHKIHPFDVVIPDGPVNRESDRICPAMRSSPWTPARWDAWDFPSATTCDSRSSTASWRWRARRF